MSGYVALVCFHVLVAVLGLGQVTAVTILGFVGEDASLLPLIRRLAQGAGISLLLMLLSGIGLTALVHGAFAEASWFRLSFVLLFVVGFLLGMVQRTLRRAKGEPKHALQQIGRLGLGACAIVAAIVVLMQAKPF